MDLAQAGGLFKQTWGENIIAQAGFGLIGFLAFLPGIALAIAFGALFPIVGIVVGIAWFAVVATVLSSLTGIFKAALYLYATDRPTPWFDQEAHGRLVRPKTGRRR